jgi:hypothetical protein
MGSGCSTHGREEESVHVFYGKTGRILAVNVKTSVILTWSLEKSDGELGLDSAGLEQEPMAGLEPITKTTTKKLRGV